MITWIMACVTSTMFSLCIKGELHGYFKRKRGLRQGDPMSPYLFTLVMEILMLILKRKVQRGEEFQYHKYCHKQKIINVCFADDLILFARGYVNSVRIIKEALDEFRLCSGLGSKYSKEYRLFLIAKFLWRVQKRIGDWKNKSLSFAGRLQLVLSVISSMHWYWALVFILPIRIIQDIDYLIRGFLWCHGDMKQGKAKVAWESLCLPKFEGGLGVRNLEKFNTALMTTHIWNILMHKESMWVRWIHAYKLKGRSFWDVPALCNVNWGWRKILQIRDIVRPFVWHRIGNGLNTSFWFDAWNEQYMVSNGTWKVPNAWFDMFPVLNQVNPQILMENRQDQILKTQDMLRQWDVGEYVDLTLLRCPLCKLIQDSHEHLFFECPFSLKVWNLVVQKAGLQNVPSRLEDIISLLKPISSKDRLDKEGGPNMRCDNRNGSFEVVYITVQEVFEGDKDVSRLAFTSSCDVLVSLSLVLVDLTWGFLGGSLRCSILRSYELSMERGFLNPKEKWGWRGVKEKKAGSTDVSGSNSCEDTSSNVAKITYHNISVSSLGSDTTDPSVQTGIRMMKGIVFGNKNDTQEGNVGQCSTLIRSTTDPNEGDVHLTRAFVVPINVTVSPTDPNNYGLIFWGPSLYAKLVTGKRVACPIVENYVKNTWSKYGLVKSKTRCLELLHMDLFGPSAIRSYGGNRYTLVIVDDYSSFVIDCANMGTIRLRRDQRVLAMVAGLPRTVYHDLYLGGKALVERENVGFNLARPLPYFRRRPPAKGVGLRVADSHTGNYPEDDFTPLKTIRRPYSVIRERILLELEGGTFEPERGYVIKPPSRM
ncbi:uncharacterized protein Tco_0230966 [Tanacetum coccineum]